MATLPAGDWVERVYVEEWGAAYGSPYLIDAEAADDGETAGVPVEDGTAVGVHNVIDAEPATPLAFVDGVRRAEAWLYCVASDGSAARGVAGANATGAVLAPPGRTAVFAHERIRRLAIWGSGAHAALRSVPGGWHWETASIASTDPQGPLVSLQDRMREAERALALELAADGYLVVLDGPLNFVVGRSARVVGYVKTHHRAFLPAEQHALVPRLALGERTSLFAIDERFSCYSRIGTPGPHASPWSGIVRLHFSGEDGLDGAKQLANTLTARLPSYAGVSHRDPRAPQNLQPIGALESHLRHLMGDAGLAARAVRDAAAVKESA